MEKPDTGDYIHVIANEAYVAIHHERLLAVSGTWTYPEDDPVAKEEVEICLQRNHAEIESCEDGKITITYLADGLPDFEIKFGKEYLPARDWKNLLLPKAEVDVPETKTSMAEFLNRHFVQVEKPPTDVTAMFQPPPIQLPLRLRQAWSKVRHLLREDMVNVCVGNSGLLSLRKVNAVLEILNQQQNPPEGIDECLETIKLVTSEWIAFEREQTPAIQWNERQREQNRQKLERYERQNQSYQAFLKEQEKLINRMKLWFFPTRYMEVMRRIETLANEPRQSGAGLGVGTSLQQDSIFNTGLIQQQPHYQSTPGYNEPHQPTSHSNYGNASPYRNDNRPGRQSSNSRYPNRSFDNRTDGKSSNTTNSHSGERNSITSRGRGWGVR